MKKFLSVLLNLSMVFCFSTAVFATENDTNGIPEYATRHTIELTLAPGETIGDDSNSGVAPYIWGDPSMSLVDHNSAYTSSFYVSDRYFAYEMEATKTDGTETQQGYCVALEYVNGGVIASMSGHADGSLYKNDWITINVDGYYRFLVSNNTDYDLRVLMTYYSWN